MPYVERWVRVDSRGRLIPHTENDGPRFLRRVSGMYKEAKRLLKEFRQRAG